MITLNKTQPEPDDLQAEREKTSGDYKTPSVLEQIKKDFKNKCYICEMKNPPVINVEHFFPHKNDHVLKYDWNNLYYACGHCNNIKLAKYNNILNCLDTNDNVENIIKLKMDPFPMMDVEVNINKEDIVEDSRVEQTRELLLKVYNGSTQLKEMEAYNLKDYLLNEIMGFQKLLVDYYKYLYDDEIKEEIKESIKRQLSKASSFSSFKWWIIKDNTHFNNEFGHLIPNNNVKVKN